MKKPTEAQVHEVLSLIGKHNKEKAVRYAVNYAMYGCHMSGEVLRTQCLYVLNNIQKWHGEDATKVREILKAFETQGFEET